MSGKTDRTALAAQQSEDGYLISGKALTKKSGLDYILQNQKVGPFGTFFGSGDSRIVNGSVWSFVACRISQNDSFLDIYNHLTRDAAQLLSLPTGVIEPGYQADIILFKIEPHWNMSSSESILSSIFLHQGNQGRTACTYKDGEIVYASDEFSNLVKQHQMSKYYLQPNIAPTNVDGTQEFDSIESALEDFRIYH